MSVFQFKHFTVNQARSAMKVGTDAMLLGALIRSEQCQRGLDIGAGTGVLSLMVAQRNPLLNVDAVELDVQSFEECTINFQSSDWSDRLTAIHADILNYNSDERYDLIFSNPPFYLNGLLSEDERRSRARHNDFMPLEKLREVIDQLLSDKGVFIVILPKENEVEWLHAFDFLKLHRKIDLFGKRSGNSNRVILEFKRIGGELLSTEFCIREDNGSYTDEYKELTAEFHAAIL